MRGQKSYLQGNLTLLQLNSWIDSQTRAVIIEFSIFNPNINLIGVAEIIVEFLPTGSILTSARFDPINIFTHLSLFQLICHILYMLFIVYFSIQEIRQSFKQGKIYFLQFWTIVEWSIIGLSWTAFGLFFYKINASYEVSQFFKKTSGFGYFKLQNITFWNLVLNYSLAFCIALGTIKFLKIFSFNKRISLLSLTLSNSLKEMINFAFMFNIIWMAFVQLFHLFFQKLMLEFSTIILSMTTCFEIMLGKFQVEKLLEANSLFGPIFYVFYNIVIIFIFLTILISIINSSFKVVHRRSKKETCEMFQYIKDDLFAKKNENMVSTVNQIVYKDHIEYLNNKIDDLLIVINDVRTVKHKSFKIPTNYINFYFKIYYEQKLVTNMISKTERSDESFTNIDI
jgi:hypothetical protein